MPTEVIIDTPMLELNKNHYVTDNQTPPVSVYASEPPKTPYEPYDKTLIFLLLLGLPQQITPF